MRPLRDAAGFTLVELLVTLAIMAILAMVAAPGVSQYLANQRVKGVAEELVSDLQFARMESVQKNAPVTVTFTTSGYSIALGATPLKTVVLTTGSSVSGGSTMSAVFDPVRATAVLTNGPDVTLANNATTRTLRVSLSTMGRVSVCTPGGSMTGYTTCS